MASRPEARAARDPNLWVEPVGSTIVARLRGAPTAEMLRECEQRVVELARDTKHVRVLYDALELVAPEVQLVLLHQQLAAERGASLGAASLRTAILVADTRSAYLARIAFGQVGEDHCRVFYNDLGAAMKWLEAPEA
ncbi:hypothetical protein H8N03_00625 [Ramlibacter sp. USB13]|uniref:Uncharacterized protein n=1 Tax=Ramlibacter cellulosilyticus TaxID=2764187 RepID=A0A923MN11_9BURK|nr:hypothetical protein [Ramlibacter cellulosilyticus]MBC5781424.1 hypothetical protein [Ramlibacter cellulosilyticus]